MSMEDIEDRIYGQRNCIEGEAENLTMLAIKVLRKYEKLVVASRVTLEWMKAHHPMPSCSEEIANLEEALKP